MQGYALLVDLHRALGEIEAAREYVDKLVQAVRAKGFSLPDTPVAAMIARQRLLLSRADSSLGDLLAGAARWAELALPGGSRRDMANAIAQAESFITALKGMGCQFALDDFGAGFSSFAYLKSLPVDFLKIDGVFVKDIVEDPIDRELVRSINEIGHVMGKQTIAEFVENEQVFELVRDLGVDYVQGHYLGQPQSSPENSDSEVDDGLNASVA